jgi:hypothetical protein
MAVQTFTLYICKHIGEFSRGRVSVNDFDMSKSIGNRPSDYVLLGKIEQEIDVPEIDTTPLQVQAIEDAIQSERAESQVRVNILLDRLSKLKAIGHDAPVNA